MFEPPPLKLHKHSGQYRAYIDGAYVYFGREFEQARTAYLLALSRCGSLNRGTVAEMCQHVIAWAEAEYKACGRWRGEAPTIRYALRFLDCSVTVNTPHGRQTVYVPSLRPDEFTVTHLAQIQRSMIERGLARTYINGQIRRIVKAFSQARIDGLCSARTVQDLRLLKPVRRGHPRVNEPGKVRSVDDATIDATLPALSPMMRSVVQVLRLDGHRVGELMALRLDMIDMAAMTASLGTDHKTGKRTFAKTLRFSAAAWQLMLPFIEVAQTTMNTRAYLFPSARNPTGYVQPDSVRCAIREACRSLGITHWHTHQLRHTAATVMARRVRVEMEREARRRVAEMLGHRSEASAATYIDPAV